MIDLNTYNYSNGKFKIGIAGLGGVGGYLAGMFLKSSNNPELLVRTHRRKMFENGLIFDSDLHGVSNFSSIQVKTIDEFQKPDILFICVKNFSLDELLNELAPIIDEKTVLVPVMNGIDPGDRVRERFPNNPVVDGVIYIVSYFKHPNIVKHVGDYAYLKIGSKADDVSSQEAADLVTHLLTRSEIEVERSSDITREIWLKFILNSGFNIETAYYDEPIGSLRIDPKKASEYESLTWEAYELAQKKGVDIRKEDIEEIIDKFYNLYTDEMSSSLHRDFKESKPTELETFGGYLCREAEKTGLSLPVSKRMYEALKMTTSQ